MTYKMVLTFKSVDEILVCDQMKAIEQYIQVVLFILQFKGVLTSKSVDEALICDHRFHQLFHLILRKCCFRRFDVENSFQV